MLAGARRFEPSTPVPNQCASTPPQLISQICGRRARSPRCACSSGTVCLLALRSSPRTEAGPRLQCYSFSVMQLRLSAPLFAAALLLAACGRSTPPPPKPTGADLAAIDTTANPCQNFYQYACGTWMAKHPIPNDQVEWGTFSELLERNRATLHSILEDASTNSAKKDPISQQVGDYYAACMNESAINAAGVQPLQSELDLLASVQTPAELAAEIARMQVNGADVAFGFGSDQDFKNANQVIAEADQGGLGLPDRDYYLKTDAKSVALRQQYLAHVAKMFTLLGDAAPKAAAEAATVLRIETALAKGS